MQRLAKFGATKNARAVHFPEHLDFALVSRFLYHLLADIRVCATASALAKGAESAQGARLSIDSTIAMFRRAASI